MIKNYIKQKLNEEFDKNMKGDYVIDSRNENIPEDEFFRMKREPHYSKSLNNSVLKNNTTDVSNEFGDRGDILNLKTKSTDLITGPKNIKWDAKQISDDDISKKSPNFLGGMFGGPLISKDVGSNSYAIPVLNMNAVKRYNERIEKKFGDLKQYHQNYKNIRQSGAKPEIRDKFDVDRHT